MSLPISPVQLLLDTIQVVHPTNDLASSFEAILTSPDNCGKHAASAIVWARNLPFAKQLPEKNGPLVQLLSLPLIAWGMRQPWADNISASHLINFWFKHESVPAMPQELALNEAWATHTIARCAQDPLVNRTRAEDLCREWYYKCDEDAIAWNWAVQPMPRVANCMRPGWTCTALHYPICATWRSLKRHYKKRGCLDWVACSKA